MEVACECGWDIPGVHKLPPHRHIHKRLVRRTSDGAEFWLPVSVDIRGFELLDEMDEVQIHVPWKALYRKDPAGPVLRAALEWERTESTLAKWRYKHRFEGMWVTDPADLLDHEVHAADTFWRTVRAVQVPR